jgi:hypothetical protein
VPPPARRPGLCRVNAHCARTRCHPSCHGRTPLSFKRRVRTVELARVANTLLDPPCPMDRRLTARVRALPSGPHRRCHLRRASGANCASGPHPARCSLADSRLSESWSDDWSSAPSDSSDSFAKRGLQSSEIRAPREPMTRATRNRLELRYCWRTHPDHARRHPCSHRGQEADLTLPSRLVTTPTGEIRLVTSTATMMELRYCWPRPELL